MRKAAVQSARGVALAAHSAAGIAHDVDRAAARLLRAAEGLSRSAIALLDKAARGPASGAPRSVDAVGDPALNRSKKAKSKRSGTSTSPVGITGLETDVMDIGAAGSEPAPKRQRPSKRAHRRARAVRAKDGATPPVELPGVEDMFDDAWADEVAIRPLTAQASATSTSQPRASRHLATRSAVKTSSPPEWTPSSTAAARPHRPPRHSSSRCTC